MGMDTSSLPSDCIASYGYSNENNLDFMYWNYVWLLDKRFAFCLLILLVDLRIYFVINGTNLEGIIAGGNSTD